MSMYCHTATGNVYYPGAVVSGVQTHACMSDDAWAALGCVPYVAPEPEPPTLADLQAAALARVRAATAAHILAVYPDWYQRDCALGVYSEALAQACADDIAACVEASNAAESAIAAATDAAGVAAAEAALALPVIGGAA